MIRATLVLGSSGDQCTETLTVPVGSGPQALTKAIGGLKQATMDVITAQMQKGGGESQVDDDDKIDLMEGEEEEGEVDIDDDNDGGARKKHVRGHKRKKDVVG